MIERRLIRQLEKVARRVRRRRVLLAWTLVWIGVAGLAAVALAANVRLGIYVPRATLGLSLLAIATAIAVGWFVHRSAGDYTRIAQLVERAYPDLRAGLLAAVYQRPSGADGRLGFMQQRVVEHVLHHAYAHAWQRVVPTWQIGVAFLANLAGFVALVIALARLAAYAAPAPLPSWALAAGEEQPASGGDYDVTIEPGTTEVERGTSLLVLARFKGPLPPDARLVYEPAGGELAQKAMLKSLDDPVFGGRIPEVLGALRYHVEFADAASDTFQVTVFEYPRLVQADAVLEFPSYTALKKRRIQDTRRVAAVEGTQVSLICRLNVPVASARLVSQEGDSLPLEAGVDPEGFDSITETEPGPADASGRAAAADPNSSQKDGVTYIVQWKLDRSQRFKLELIDAQGRRNKQPPEFIVTMLPNKPPDLKLVAPARDLQVSPLEELDVQANVWDDYGVGRFGVQYALAGDEPREVVLAEGIGGRERQNVEHTVAFEELEAAPDQLLSYHFWAEDAGPDGQPRRTFSDMYFAEVRHFEEIFRQGQQPSSQQQQQQQQQQQGNAAQAEQLAQLQKQIINATWTVVRREIGATVSAGFSPDVQLIVDSQSQAFEQASEMSARLQDAQSKEFLADAQSYMQGAIDHLSAAVDGTVTQPLQTALAAEQSAYQALLKLRAREHEVVRANPSSQGAGAGSNSRSQQQLQQLQLRDDQNRYETESTARQQQEQQVRETRQVLNRLRELARRQGDLNQRLKELNAALEEARTEQEREEIRQQLKRLREEQQQIMRDSEELQSRMQQPENQEQMSEAQQQLDETRENLRQASEALEQGQVSRAITSGTRAEREFEELRDEFRQAASGQFNEEMRDMRDQARQLDETQQQLAEQLSEIVNPQPQASPSLRSTGDREQIEEQLAEQRARLNELLQRMTETVVEAETAEPLLASELYETIRQAQQQDAERALRDTESSLRRGLVNDALQQERLANEGIRDIRSGVERAADSVLGDETEALRRAQEELNELVDQLRAEADRANPAAAQARRDEGREAGDDNANPDGQPRDGEPQPGDAQRPGEQRPGEQRPGEQREPSDQRTESQRSGSAQQGDQQPGGQSQSGQPQDGQSQDGQSQDGQSQSGQSQGGQPQDGQSQSGQSQGGQAQQGEDADRAGRRPAGDETGAQPGRGQPQPGEPSDEPDARSGAGGRRSGLQRLLEQGGMTGGPGAAPITGADYRPWSDRLRDVEEMVGDPELSAEAARVRDRVRGFRQDFTRHSQEPNWDLVEMQVIQPLAELRDRVANEVLRRTSQDALVPIDRDPVPPRFADPVRRYFERLGTGR